MTGDQTLRLFVAAAVPGDQLEWLERETRPLRNLFEAVRWTGSDNQHVTLKFLGSTTPALVDDVAARCSSVAREVRPSDIRLGSLGAFPSPRRARVLWVGLEDPAETLAGLAGRLDAALEPLGWAAEKRTFSAHLTLGRFKVPQRLGPLPPLRTPPAAFPLTQFGLWRSRLSPQGARYDVLESFPLTGA